MVAACLAASVAASGGAHALELQLIPSGKGAAPVAQGSEEQFLSLQDIWAKLANYRKRKQRHQDVLNGLRPACILTRTPSPGGAKYRMPVWW